MKMLPGIMVLLVISPTVSYGSAHGQNPVAERCDKWERSLLKSKDGRQVLLVEEGCSGFANGTRFSIAVVLPNGKRKAVFKYEDASWNAAYYGQTTPVIEWISANRLRISVGAVAAIDEKLDELGDIHIEYRIGRVLYKK